jgi:hypothetical protein
MVWCGIQMVESEVSWYFSCAWRCHVFRMDVQESNDVTAQAWLSLEARGLHWGLRVEACATRDRKHDSHELSLATTVPALRVV